MSNRPIGGILRGGPSTQTASEVPLRAFGGLTCGRRGFARIGATGESLVAGANTFNKTTNLLGKGIGKGHIESYISLRPFGPATTQHLKTPTVTERAFRPFQARIFRIRRGFASSRGSGTPRQHRSRSKGRRHLLPRLPSAHASRTETPKRRQPAEAMAPPPRRRASRIQCPRDISTF